MIGVGDPTILFHFIKKFELIHSNILSLKYGYVEYNGVFWRAELCDMSYNVLKGISPTCLLEIDVKILQEVNSTLLSAL